MGITVSFIAYLYAMSLLNEKHQNQKFQNNARMLIIPSLRSH